MSSIWTRHLGAIWTHVASACHPDESSRGRYSATAGRFMHKGTSTGKIVGRCNVKNPREDGRDPGWNCLEVVYRHQSEADQVTATLMRVSNETGGIHEVVRFDSNADDRETSHDEQARYVIFHYSFDFVRYAYYVEIMVDRSQASADAGIYPSVSIVRMKEIPERLDWEIRLDRLRVVRPNESADEPYFVMVGFRSTVGTPGSTSIFWGGELDDDWAEGSEAGDEHNIPRRMGVVAFPGVEYVSESRLRDLVSPEVIGAAAIAFESDTTPWSTMRDLILQAQDGLEALVRERIEESSLFELVNFDEEDMEELAARLRSGLSIPWWEVVRIAFESFFDIDDLIGHHLFVFIPTEPWRHEFPTDEVEDGLHLGALLEYRFTVANDDAIRFEGQDAIYLVNASVVALPPE
jgi:hypothetical protein